MSNPPNTVVDSLTVLVQDQSVITLGELTHPDGSVYDLTGKTMTATIRRVRNPGNVLHTDYEDMTVTIPSSETTAANGGWMITWSPSSTYFTAPARAEQWERYYMQPYVVTDDTYGQLIEFGVRRKLD